MGPSQAQRQYAFQHEISALQDNLAGGDIDGFADDVTLLISIRRES